MPKDDVSVIALSAAGVAFILLGLVTLALPDSYEGLIIWQLDPLHAISWLDVAGGFALGMGVILIWLSGRIWNRKLMS